MAILKINDPDTYGRHGNVTVYPCLGQVVMRTMPKKRTDNPTPGQLVHRAKFSVVALFLSPLRHLVAKSYSGLPGQNRARLGAASSYHTAHAIVGEYPGFSIDCSKVVLSRGYLPALDSPAVSPQPGSIALSWHDNSHLALASPNDQLVLVAYHPELAHFAICDNAAIRSDRHFVFALPEGWTDASVHVWGSFSDAEGISWSTSSYLGRPEV